MIMDIALLENNTVTNVIVADLGWAQSAFPEYQVVECPAGVGIGWVLNEGEWSPPLTETPPVVNVSQITQRQGLLALFQEEGIKKEFLQGIIDNIQPEGARYIAQVEFDGFYWGIENPTVQNMAAACGFSEERLQELFNIASTL